ncbi:MAG: hypothetical protein ACOX8W_02895 [bacterium]
MDKVLTTPDNLLIIWGYTGDGIAVPVRQEASAACRNSASGSNQPHSD